MNRYNKCNLAIVLIFETVSFLLHFKQCVYNHCLIACCQDQEFTFCSLIFGGLVSPDSHLCAVALINVQQLLRPRMRRKYSTRLSVYVSLLHGVIDILVKPLSVQSCFEERTLKIVFFQIQSQSLKGGRNYQVHSHYVSALIILRFLVLRSQRRLISLTYDRHPVSSSK